MSEIEDYERKIINKKEILNEVEKLKECTVKSWRSMTNLIKRGIIKKIEKGYKLTENGIKSVQKIQENTTLSGSKRGINHKESEISKSVLKKFRRLSIDPELEKQQNEQFSSIQKVLRMNLDINSSNLSKNIDNNEKIKFSEVKLIIDVREMQFHKDGKKKAFLKEKLDDLCVNSEIRNLSVGDMLWIGITTDNEELVLDYVVERKAIEDLCSSIVDGRYVEQKYRLKRSSFNRIIYLLEGNTNEMFGNARSNFSAQTLQKALCSTQVCTNFNTHQTKNLTETAIFLQRTTRMLTKKYISDKNTFKRSDFITYSKYYSNNLKTGDITVQDVFAKQLLQITGCSPDRVFAILQVYPSILSLIHAYDNCDNLAEAEMLLVNITCGKKQRKLGPVLSKRIYTIYSPNK